MKKYIILDKLVGETPLSCAEAYRAEHKELEGIPMAYAGRLDPMASGKLLILLGDECKNQTNYHGLDKEYQFSILLGIESDSLDVMGRLSVSKTQSLEKKEGLAQTQLSERVRLGRAAWSALGEDLSLSEAEEELTQITESFVGKIELPYPHFSAKTVKGKPLHMWTMENRLNEIEIPTKESEIYELEFTKREIINRKNLVDKALEKVNSVPPVTELRKALGNDFRRVDVRKDWDQILKDKSLPSTYTIIHFRCVASSGTYMRTLASEIAKKLGTTGLAWHIHRTKIGTFDPTLNKWEILY